jgi:hypothetical protein
MFAFLLTWTYNVSTYLLSFSPVFYTVSEVHLVDWDTAQWQSTALTCIDPGFIPTPQILSMPRVFPCFAWKPLLVAQATSSPTVTPTASQSVNRWVWAPNPSWCLLKAYVPHTEGFQHPYLGATADAAASTQRTLSFLSPTWLSSF